MKRPLCHLAILLTAAVFIYLELFGPCAVNSGALAPYRSPSSDSVSAGECVPSDGDYIVVTGKVQNKEFKKGTGSDHIPVIYIIPTDHNISDFSMVQCYMDTDIGNLPAIGEYVQIGGKVRYFSSPTNPGEFDSRLYYSTLKISYRISNGTIKRSGGRADMYREFLFNVRMYLERALDSSLSEQDSSIMKAMLLGDKAYMDEDIKQLYKNSGIMHILAVSGLHISIVGLGIYRLIKKLGGGKIISAVIPIFVMYSYGSMCGMGTSSFRAICMFTLRMLAPIFGRTYDVLSALALSGILLLLDQPLYVYNSGFLFSFGAVIGITVLLPCLKVHGNEYAEAEMKFTDDKKSRVIMLMEKIVSGLLSGISVGVVTLPVYSRFYYTYPVHSVFLNLFVIPLMGFLMVCGIICMFLSVVSSFLGAIPGIFVHLILSFYKFMCSSVFFNRNLTWYMGQAQKYRVVIYVALVVIFVLVSKILENEKMRDRLKKYLSGISGGKMSIKTVEIIRYFVLILAVFILTFTKEAKIEIDMVDVGQGDGIVISSKGEHILIDGGSTSKKNVGKYQIIPFLKYKGIGTIDGIVLTHEDEDHLSGIMDILDDMEKGGLLVKELIMPDVSSISRGENYHKLEKRALELGVTVRYISAGMKFNAGNADFICINPKDGMVSSGANEYSTVLFMEYKDNNGRFTALFTGDVEGEGQEDIKKIIRANTGQFEDLTLLKVAHHGSMYTTDMEFLEMLNPRIALISCGKDNRYGHPHLELIERLEKVGAKIYRTDEVGEINVRIENGNVVIRPFLLEN